MQNAQGINFIWTQTYGEIFKSALVYLWKFCSEEQFLGAVKSPTPTVKYL